MYTVGGIQLVTCTGPGFSRNRTSSFREEWPSEVTLGRDALGSDWQVSKENLFPLESDLYTDLFQ